MESLVRDVRYSVLTRFPIIAPCSKGANYFHRVVVLVVISMSVVRTFHKSQVRQSSVHIKHVSSHIGTCGGIL